MTKLPNFNRILDLCTEKLKEMFPGLMLTDFMYYDLDMQVWSQYWPNTATGFDAPGMCSGQAITREYTSVVKITGITFKPPAERIREKEMYMVFFGERPAYVLIDPNDVFYQDVKERNVVGQKDIKRYQKEETKAIAIEKDSKRG